MKREEDLVFDYSGVYDSNLLEKVISSYSQDKHLIFIDEESGRCIIKVWIKTQLRS
jgi:hypothetical protein